MNSHGRIEREPDHLRRLRRDRDDSGRELEQSDDREKESEDENRAPARQEFAEIPARVSETEAQPEAREERFGHKGEALPAQRFLNVLGAETLGDEQGLDREGDHARGKTPGGKRTLLAQNGRDCQHDGDGGRSKRHDWVH